MGWSMAIVKNFDDVQVLRNQDGDGFQVMVQLWADCETIDEANYFLGEIGYPEKVNDPLAESHWMRNNDGKLQKSCPNCSVEAGKLVFKNIEDFGFRQQNGTYHIQSWCEECR